jgi:hypothetical protein
VEKVEEKRIQIEEEKKTSKRIGRIKKERRRKIKIIVN